MQLEQENEGGGGSYPWRRGVENKVMNNRTKPEREDVNEWRLQKKNKTLSFMQQQQQPGFRTSDSLFLETWSGSFASSALSCEREADTLRRREEGE